MKLDMSILLPSGHTLVTYYMLPLLNLNKNSFGSSFKNSYIDKDGIKIYVELGINMRAPTYKSNSNYISELIHRGHLIVIFLVPSIHLLDATLFVQGKYSEMSVEAKKAIFKKSTLDYNKSMGSFKNSHLVLQALDKTKTVRNWLENHLQVDSIPNSIELLEKPAKFWFIENRLK